MFLCLSDPFFYARVFRRIMARAYAALEQAVGEGG
jgi:hypothetical protein